MVSILALVALIHACGSSTTPDPGSTFTKASGWTCASGINCQDVYDFQFTGGTKVTFKVTPVSAGSVAQVALYGPGVALGGTNLLTGDATELLCGGDLSNCDNNTAGQDVESFSIPSTGAYRFAVTRQWGRSCSSTGTYTVTVTSTSTFQSSGQTADDTASLATGANCPAK